MNSLLKKEEEDLAKAIQLSLKESSQIQTTASNKKNDKIKYQVKALYDFEAAEENEITFRAGDILFVSDNSDTNWWKGFDSNGKEGLFPSNFVTSDLNFSIQKEQNSSKKVSFNKNFKVDSTNSQKNHVNGKNVINETKIDNCLELIQNADPTGEFEQDSQMMIDLEDECYFMGPLIDQKLQTIDQKHSYLEELNIKILESFQMYNNLMKESITKAYMGPYGTAIQGHISNNMASVNTMNSFIPHSSQQEEHLKTSVSDFNSIQHLNGVNHIRSINEMASNNISENNSLQIINSVSIPHPSQNPTVIQQFRN